jgi:beta-lactamase class D
MHLHQHPFFLNLKNKENLYLRGDKTGNTMETKKKSTLGWWAAFILATPLYIYLAMEVGFTNVYLIPFYCYFLVKALDII